MKTNYWVLKRNDSRALYWHGDEDKLLINPLSYSTYLEYHDLMYFYTRKYESNISLLNCYKTRDKSTNLVSLPGLYWLGIDELLKNYFENFKIMKCSFIKCQYIYRRNVYSDIYSIFWKESMYKYLEFTECEFLFNLKQNKNNAPMKVIKINNYQEFVKAWDVGIIYFEKIKFNEESPVYDIFYIDDPLEKYIVTTEFKEALEGSGFTGFSFRPSNIKWEL